MANQEIVVTLTNRYLIMVLLKKSFKLILMKVLLCMIKYRNEFCAYLSNVILFVYGNVNASVVYKDSDLGGSDHFLRHATIALIVNLNLMIDVL